MVSIRLLMMMRYDAIGTKYSNTFSIFVGLRWLLWAFVGLHGCRPCQRGVWWVWCSRLSCTVKKNTATGVAGTHGSGVSPGLPAPVPAGTRTRDPRGLACPLLIPSCRVEDGLDCGVSYN